MSAPPVASSIKSLRGTKRADRTKKYDKPAKSDRCPPAPRYLSEGARIEWKRIAPVAWAQGTLAKADVRAFALLCECLHSENEARAYIAKHGHSDELGRTRPEARAMAQARSQAVSLLKEFALTARSRTNVELTPKEDADPFAEFV